eukprot:19168-Heterococcus_DN1.PRE.1
MCSDFSSLLIVAKVPELSCILGAAISSCKQQREEQFDKSFTQVLKHHGAFDAESMAHQTRNWSRAAVYCRKSSNGSSTNCVRHRFAKYNYLCSRRQLPSQDGSSDSGSHIDELVLLDH